MKRVVLIFFVFLGVFSSLVTANPESFSMINIKIINETAFNSNMFINYSLFISNEDYNFSMVLDKRLKNPIFYDNKDNLKMINSSEKGLDKDDLINLDYIIYNLEWNNGKPGYVKGIYFNTSNSYIDYVSDNFIDLEVPTYTANLRSYNENYDIKIEYPENLKLVGIDETSIINSSIVKDESYYRARYTNPYGYLHFTFIKKDNYKNFVQRKYENTTFIIQNNDKLLNSLDEAMKYKNLILKYPYEKKDIIFVSFANLSKIDNVTSAYYGRDKSVIINENLYGEEEISAIILHELTHYAFHSYYGNMNFWGDLEEGFAEYVRDEYIDIKYPNYEGHIPNMNSFLGFSTKPSRKSIESWYSNAYIPNEDLNIFRYKLNWTGVSLYYPILSYISNYYIESYGEEVFYRALERGKELVDIGMKSPEGVDGDIIEIYYLRGLIEESPEPMNRQKLFFPNLELYKNNKEEFWKTMDPYINDFDEEESKKYYRDYSEMENQEIKPEMNNTNYIDKKYYSLLKDIFLGLVILIIVVILFFIFKSKNVQKRKI